MSVSINNVNTYSVVQTDKVTKNTEKIDNKVDNIVSLDETGVLKTDTYQKSAEASAAEKQGATSDKNVKSNNYKVDVDALIEENNQRIQNFQKMLMSMITKQGEKSNTAFGNNSTEKTFSVSIFGHNVNATQADIDAAKASIAEGGEWSVNAVADRIMNFAYALSGGDESKIQLLKDAALKGFYEAGFDPEDRSTMPEITGQTYDEVVSRFEDWEKNGMKTYNNTDFDNAVKKAPSSDKATALIQ